MTAPDPLEPDVNGRRIRCGDRVLAYLRRFAVVDRQVLEDGVEVRTLGEELALPDVVSHEGVVEYGDYGWWVRLDAPDEAGVVARRMGGAYAYEVKA